MYIKNSALLFMIMVIAGGCTSTPVVVTSAETANTQPATSTPQGSYKFTIAASEGWYTEGHGLSEEIDIKIPAISSDVKETASLMESMDILTSGKAGMAFVYDYHVVLANQGKLMTAFPDAPMEKIAIKCGTEMTRPMFPDYAEAARIVLPLYEEQLHIVVSATSGITSVNDIKGKHISTGEAGSATEQQSRFVLASLGIDWETGISREQFGLPAAIKALETGEIDAFFWSGISSNTELSEFLNSKRTEFKLIPIAGEEAEKITQANPGIFHASKFPADISNHKDIGTLATTVVLAAMADFPEQYMVQILATFFNDSSTLWKSGFPISPEDSMSILNTASQPYLHQGAKNYFTEQGVLK